MSKRTVTKVMWGRVLLHNKLLTPDQWFDCLTIHAQGGQDIEQILLEKRLLIAKQVEAIRPKIDQLVSKHLHEYETPADDGMIPLDDPDLASRITMHDKAVNAAPVLPPAPASGRSETVFHDDGTIELDDSAQHDALNKGNDVAWAQEIGGNAEHTPVTMDQLSKAAQKRRADDDNAISLS